MEAEVPSNGFGNPQQKECSQFLDPMYFVTLANAVPSSIVLSHDHVPANCLAECMRRAR